MEETENVTASDREEENVRNSLAIERTRLASERTVSAWIRTGLACVGGGFALIRFVVFHTEQHRFIADAIGELLIIWGIFIFILSFGDYKASCKQFKAHITKRNEWWITTTIVLFVLVSLFLIVSTLT